MLKLYQIKITDMWYKINDYYQQGLKTGQISSLLGLHPDTVRAYRKMSAEEVERRVNSPYNNHKPKLHAYVDFTTRLLESLPLLTAPQVHDRLKEEYPDLPEVSDKTVYNFVESIRTAQNLPKKKEEVRQMVKLADPDYGKEAQVDWGEKSMHTANGRWKKVYFFVMIMSRSRHKFVYFQDIPFTAQTTVYAHHLAFEFFGGVPERILYDQDVKLIVSENLGDYILTKEMEAFRKSAGFTPVFCRPADPQSKGKVENAVGYVKRNFIKGRQFTTIESLNEQATGWLERTGNGKRHATTRLIPAEEFEKERRHLTPYTAKIEKPASQGRPYTVRRDNTISYHSCFYQLPKGTYEGDGTLVRVVEVGNNRIEIYNVLTGEFIIEYTVSAISGKHIEKPELLTRDSRDASSEERDLLERYEANPRLRQRLMNHLESIRQDRPRYYNASVRVLSELFPQLPDTIASQLLDTLMENKTVNAFDAFEIGDAMLARNNLPRLVKKPNRYGKRGHRVSQSANLEPQRSDIASYDNLINELSQN